MVIKKIFIILISVLFFKSAESSQILDFETEIFIEEIISNIKLKNNINKNIKFKILSDNKINAFVNEFNIIYITSGLIENCPNYVALVSVIAHEIGHIDLNHIKVRKSSINKMNNLKSASNLSIIAGSMISRNPSLIQGIAVSSAGLSNMYIEFSKEQEREADFYSLETLKKLDLNSKSIIKLLQIIEKKSLARGLTKEKQRTSSHPYFEERINIINFVNENSGENYDKKLNQKFKFIQSKFIGYNGNMDVISKLNEPYKTYSKSIHSAKKGDLTLSLRELNRVIKSNNNAIFLLETKADILFSYGYTKESIKFYKKVLKEYPNNLYAQIRIFSNIDFQNSTRPELEKLFINNLNLLNKFYNNRNILLTYYDIAKKNQKKEWIEFLNYWINKNHNDTVKIIKELESFKKTKDNDLFNLVTTILSKY